MRLALVLAIIAALLLFIPNIGQVVAAIPAVLIASVSGADQVLYVLVLYAAVQTVESYILTPLLQQRMVDLPPGLTIMAQVLFGFLAGALGVILATPLAAAGMTMVKMWYLEDLLGDPSEQE
jgi:predicted PurR-regulated permease PerM